MPQPVFDNYIIPNAGGGIYFFSGLHNGKVERSHRKDDERFYATHSFDSSEDFARQLEVYNRRDYNNFPMRPLGWKTPEQVLKDYLRSV